MVTSRGLGGIWRGFAAAAQDPPVQANGLKKPGHFPAQKCHFDEGLLVLSTWGIVDLSDGFSGPATSVTFGHFERSLRIAIHDRHAQGVFVIGDHFQSNRVKL